MIEDVGAEDQEDHDSGKNYQLICSQDNWDEEDEEEGDEYGQQEAVDNSSS